MKKYGMVITLLAVAILLITGTILPARAAPKFFDPHTTHLFQVEIDGLVAGRFQEISGLSSSNEVIEIEEGGEDRLIRKQPGQVIYGDITFRREYSGDSVMSDWVSDWFKAAVSDKGDYSRKKISIILLDEKQNEIKRWNCFEAFPRSWRLIPLDSKANDVLIEEIVIVIDYFEEA